jgi:hypothetical protein
MNSHLDPDHPRFRTKAQWRVMRFISPWISRFIRLFDVSAHRAGQTIETKSRRGGRCFYRIDSMQTIKHPRVRDEEGAWVRETSGVRLIRVDNEGERLLRARQQEPGMSGKSFRRKLRKELRAEWDKARA